MSIRPRRRDRWVPLIPPRYRWPILILWIVEPITRGLDYVTGDFPDNGQQLSVVERSLPLQAWGVLCLVAGVTILVGFVWRLPKVAIAGLHVAGATYMTLTIGLLAAVPYPPTDGFRGPTMFAIFALSYWFAALGYVQQLHDEEIADARERAAWA